MLSIQNGNDAVAAAAEAATVEMGESAASHADPKFAEELAMLDMPIEAAEVEVLMSKKAKRNQKRQGKKLTKRGQRMAAKGGETKSKKTVGVSLARRMR